MPHEPLTSQLVAELIQKLLVAFPSRNIAGQNAVHTADIYRDGLRGLSGESVRAAVVRCIQDDTYFPKVARLRELAAAWEKHNRVNMPDPIDTDPLWCGHCRSRSTWVKRWHPIVDEINRPMLSADRKYVLLEPFERLLCACAAKPAFEAIDGATPPAARSDALPRSALGRAVVSATVVTVENSDAA